MSISSIPPKNDSSTELVAYPKTIVTKVQKLVSSVLPSSTSACLVIIYGAELGRRIELEEGSIEVGRSSNCELVIDDDSVSRQHARIFWSESSYVLKDLGSTNHSYINDKIVHEQSLVDGDLVKIGRAILKFISGNNIEVSYHEEIYRLMTFDGLTGIYNRRYFYETLHREISRSQRYVRPLSLVVFDIDFFKSVNDTHGHLAGDALLRQLAQLVRNRIRREDIFARLGGEEFAILLPEIESQGALVFSEKIRRIVEENRFHYEQLTLSITISLGVAVWRSTFANGEEFFKMADDALYVAKQNGRNRVHILPESS